MNTHLGKNPAHRGWSDDPYIPKGKISWLALLEIPIAMLFYWHLANFLERHLLLLISACAIPLLLLRSETSIARALVLLKKIHKKRNLNLTVSTNILLINCCLFLLFLMHLVGRKAGWISNTFIPNFGFFLAALLFLQIVIFIAICMLTTGSIAETVDELESTEKSSFFLQCLIAAFAFSIVGLYCRVRAMASWSSLRDGILNFSENWKRTVLFSDMRDMPTLMPRVEQIDPYLTVAGLQKLTKISSHIFIAPWILIFFFYFTATLYRWNIKASSFIWGPIALGLSPPNWRNYTELREQSSLSTDKWLFGTSVAFLATLIAILAIPHLPNDFIEALPKWMNSPTVIAFRPQSNTLRYSLLCLFSLTFGTQLFLALRMRTQHDKPLSSATDFIPYLKEELKDDLNSFTKQAKQVHRILKINTALAIFTIWAFALKFALDKWPNELQKVVWDWLKPLL